MGKNKKTGFGIIGLGRFGFALAKFLAGAGEEVLVIDENEDNIRKIRDIVQEAFLVGSLTSEALEETGIGDCHTVVVCISKVDVSVLTTQRVLEMGVSRVLSKADSKEHGMILEKLGADVVFPEIETATRMGAVLLESKAIDLMRLNGDYVISEIKIPKMKEKLTVEKLRLEKFGLKLIAVEREPAETTLQFDEETTLSTDDAIVVIGRFANVEKFENHVIKD